MYSSTEWCYLYGVKCIVALNGASSTAVEVSVSRILSFVCKIVTTEVIR